MGLNSYLLGLRSSEGKYFGGDFISFNYASPSILKKEFSLSWPIFCLLGLLMIVHSNNIQVFLVLRVQSP